MSGSGRIQGRTGDQREPNEPAAGQAARSAPQVRPLLDDVDGLLEEIDQVLEVNAEEFVRGYVQKGGQ
jgi:ubiquitin-like protein Pup